MYDEPQGGAVQPLTRRGNGGAVYRRTAEVEAQLAAVAGLPADEVIARAQLCDRADAGYLREEALVYLIRSFHRRGDTQAVNALFTVLLDRCEGQLKHRLGGLGVDGFEDAYGDVAGELVASMLDLASDRGDFLQVRFWPTLDRMAISIFRRHVEMQRKMRRTFPVGVHADDDETPAGVPDLPDLALPAALLAEYREALEAVHEPYRTVFVLRYYHGWPVEDRDPAVMTISRYYDKTSRTIRNYLHEAERALAAWRGEQP